MATLITLFLTFLKIGIFTFGGGYAMIALIQNEVVVKHAWMSAQEFTDLLAVSQMTPGPIGINTATYAGYTAMHNAGASVGLSIVGAVVASVAVMVLPMVLMLVVCRFLQRYSNNPLVDRLLNLLRISIVGLIASAALCLFTIENFGTPSDSLPQFLLSIAIFVVVLIVSMLPKRKESCQRRPGPIVLILMAGVVGALFMR